MAKKNWIAGAIRQKGALRKKAKAAGQMTSTDNIKQGFIEAMAKKKGKVGKQARLAKTLKKLRKQ